MFLFKKVPSISVAQLEEKLAEPIELIDVRSKMEFSSGHISRAKNIPLDKIANFKPKTKGPIYIICQSGARSKQAAKYLNDQGYEAYNIDGGLMRWTKQLKVGK
ncbi:MAG: rhodanese-like domain-containing protein [Vagococcus sp.]|uniref:rhodanese-like domain-containing protein n=1 Tax=Vagococcus sp. TaxID=1933889 RepID=UPI002FCBD8B8